MPHGLLGEHSINLPGWVLADEYIKGKKGEPSEQKKDGKRKEQDVAKDPQQEKGRPKWNQAPSLALKPFTHWFTCFTQLNKPREQILM